MLVSDQWEHIGVGHTGWSVISGHHCGWSGDQQYASSRFSLQSVKCEKVKHDLNSSTDTWDSQQKARNYVWIADQRWKRGDSVSRRAGTQLDATKTHLLALPHNHCLRPAMTCWLNENLYFKSRLCSNCHSAHFFVFCITRRHYKGSSQESWQLWMGKRSRTQKNANALQWHSTIYRIIQMLCSDITCIYRSKCKCSAVKLHVYTESNANAL